MAEPSDPPVPMVQYCGAGEKKRWLTLLLHQLLETECQNEDGCLPPASHAGNHGEYGGSPPFLLHGPQKWFLAGEDG